MNFIVLVGFYEGIGETTLYSLGYKKNKIYNYIGWVVRNRRRRKIIVLVGLQCNEWRKNYYIGWVLRNRNNYIVLIALQGLGKTDIVLVGL